MNRVYKRKEGKMVFDERRNKLELRQRVQPYLLVFLTALLSAFGYFYISSQNNMTEMIRELRVQIAELDDKLDLYIIENQKLRVILASENSDWRERIASRISYLESTLRVRNKRMD